MGRRLLIVLSSVGGLAFLALVALVALVYTGSLTPEKLRTLIKYSPLATATMPASISASITTTLLRLQRLDLNLPAMGAGFVNGGGAFIELAKGILIAERSGRFFFVDPSGQTPKLTLTPIAIDTNEAGFESAAKAEGYDVKPGRNVGYAGLGMRLHDLLLLRDGKRLMASFTRWSDAKACATLIFAIAEFMPNADVPEVGPWREMFETAPCLKLSGIKRKPFAGHQAGGRMVELADSRILVTVGDFKNDGEKRELSTADAAIDYGKTHVIDLASGEVSRRFTIGHRNPQGLTIADNGDIWSTEHGPQGGDEVNRLIPGADYGWPKVTLGMDCRGCDWQIEGRHEGYQKPAWAYVPSIGISNLIQIHNFAPLWDGDLLVASLKGETLHRLRLDGRRVMYDEPIRIGDRIRDLQQLRDGQIALWTDTGKLIFLTAELQPSRSETLAAKLSPAAQEVVAQCRLCHDLDSGQGRPGSIPLWGIVGRKPGAIENADYSPAMAGAGGAWSVTALDRFLADPQTAIPGTSMPFDGVASEDIRKEVVAFLATLK